TTVAQGKLTTLVNGALPAATELILGTANSNLTGDVDLHGTSQTVSTLTVASGNSGGTGNFITSTTTLALLTVSSTTVHCRFDGLITGPIGLIKDGAGTTLTLAAANTYTFATGVQDGTLRVGVDNALPTAIGVFINGPTGSGNALLDINGKNQAVGALTFT